MSDVSPVAAPQYAPFAKDKLGDCYENAAQSVLFASDPNVQLVHGFAWTTTNPRVRTPHAWVEHGDVVLDNATLFPKRVHYAAGWVEEDTLVRYSVEETRAKVLEMGTWGPWEPCFCDYKEDLGGR